MATAKTSAKTTAKPSTNIVAGFDKDPFTTVFQGLLKPSDDTLASQGGSKGMAIYDEIERDCHAYAVIQKRKYAVVSFPWDVDPASDDSPDVKAAEGIKEILEGVDIDGLTLSLLDAFMKGFAVSEVEWSPETWFPVKFHARDQRRFVFDAESKPRLITVENRTTGEELPERKFIVHRFGAKNGNPYGLGLGSKLFWPAWFKKQGLSYWLAFAEKFGGPTALGKYPEGLDDKQKQALLESLGRISQETAIIAPLGTEVELIEASRTGSIDTYERLLRYMDEEISKAVLGETLTTSMGDKSSSLAASQTHNGVRLELVRADADLLSNTLNESLLTWLTELHFPGAKPPRLWRRVEESLDTKMEAEKDALVFGMGYEPEEEFIQEKYGVGWKKRAIGENMGGYDWGSQGTQGTTPGTPPGPGSDAPDVPEAPQGGVVNAVQDTALNGAQVTSLVQVIEAVAAGTIPKETAKHLIRAAFPSISPETINGMVDPVEIKEAAKPTPEPAKEPVGFAEQARPRSRDVTDDLADKLEIAAADAMDGLLEPIRRLVSSAASFTEIIDGIRNLYPDMDTENFAVVMKDALVASGMAGAASVNVRQRNG